MSLNKELKTSIDKSVLCWLATVSSDQTPNVSPKECFTYYGTSHIIIANIASPQTVRNIQQNNRVCISFIDVLIQKGFQIKGRAEIIQKEHSEFENMHEILSEMTKGKFPIPSITRISIEKVKPIIAPSYILYPETTEEEQIEDAKRTYGF